MKAYRSKHQVLGDVLRSVQKTQNKTYIMYHAFLSYTQLNAYLAYCIKAELIAQTKAGFTITEKGRKSLELISGLGTIRL